MLEALDRPLGLFAHQRDPSSQCPGPCIVGIELHGVFDQCVRPIILPAGVTEDMGGLAKDRAIVTGELAGPFRQLNGFGPLGPGKRRPHGDRPELDGVGQRSQLGRIVGIETDRSTKPVLPFGSEPLRPIHRCCHPPQEAVIAVHFVGRHPASALHVVLLQLGRNRANNLCCYLVLQIEYGGQRAIKFIGPKMGTALGVDELPRDANAVPSPPHATFQDVAHAQFASYTFDVDRPAFVREGRVASDDEEGAKT